MKDRSKKALLIARAKRTALGRFLCRLAGDNAGAVMMEYVVLGVLVVAAVVGLVVAFGDTIGGGIKTMIAAIVHPSTVRDTIEDARDSSDDKRDDGNQTLTTVNETGD